MQDIQQYHTCLQQSQPADMDDLPDVHFDWGDWEELNQIFGDDASNFQLWTGPSICSQFFITHCTQCPSENWQRIHNTDNIHHTDFSLMFRVSSLWTTNVAWSTNRFSAAGETFCGCTFWFPPRSFIHLVEPTCWRRVNVTFWWENPHKLVYIQLVFLYRKRKGLFIPSFVLSVAPLFDFRRSGWRRKCTTRAIGGCIQSTIHCLGLDGCFWSSFCILVVAAYCS